MDRKQLVMFGGCFNPPLNSHFLLAQQLVNEYENIEKIIFIPANSQYQKAELASNSHRYNMLKLVCDNNEKFDVSTIELDSPRPLYTIETLRILQKKYPNNEIAFTIGSDNLKQLSTWKEADKLVKEFKIYVLERGDDNIEEIIQTNEFLKENQGAFIKSKVNIISNLSSTFVRQNIKNKKSIRYFLPEEVIEYIKKNNLYC